MAATKPTPVQRFAQASSQSQLKLDVLPSLHGHVSKHGLMEGLKQFDLAMENWRQNAEKNINEKVQPTVPQGNGG